MSTLRLKSRRREDQGSKWGRILIAILATIGVIDTGSITLKRFGFLGSLTCPGGNQGCDQVLNSPWGSIPFGESLIPLSSIGLLSYLIVLLFAIIPFLSGLFKKKNNLYRPTWWGLFIISTCMFIFSGLLMILMVYKIQAFCFFCVLSALISTLILVITILNGGWENPRELIFRGFIISIIVILSGLIWSSSVDPSKQELTTAEIGIAPPIKSISSSSSISLAKHLTANKIVLFNAWWCPHCHDQKELFGKEAVNELMLIECASDGKNNQADLCKKKGITGFPSWEINGQLESGVKSLKELAEISGYQGSTDF